MSIADGQQAGFTEAARRSWRLGALSTRPVEPTKRPLPDGVHWPLGDTGPAVFVPPSLPDGPVPLVVFLHGAASNPQRALPVMHEEADRRKFLVLVPKSRDYTWDVIRGGFGPDVGALDSALAALFDHFGVDRHRTAIAGFSDGASYALSLGLANGELFSHIFAFSPGFAVPARRQGHPAVYVSHGVSDAVLSIDRCSRRIVPALRSQGYEVDYREFAGGHEVPAEVVTEASALLA